MVEFTSFDVEDHSRCGFDYLKIIDGDGTILMDKKCGYDLPQNIRSRTKTIHIIFDTDGSVVRSGWRIKWNSFTMDSGRPEASSGPPGNEVTGATSGFAGATDLGTSGATSGPAGTTADGTPGASVGPASSTLG